MEDKTVKIIVVEDGLARLQNPYEECELSPLFDYGDTETKTSKKWQDFEESVKIYPVIDQNNNPVKKGFEGEAVEVWQYKPTHQDMWNDADKIDYKRCGVFTVYNMRFAGKNFEARIAYQVTLPQQVEHGDFIEYVQNQRHAFANDIGSTFGMMSTSDKVTIENLLIAYDQLVEKAQQTTALNAECERLRELLKKVYRATYTQYSDVPVYKTLYKEITNTLNKTE